MTGQVKQYPQKAPRRGLYFFCLLLVILPLAIFDVIAYAKADIDKSFIAVLPYYLLIILSSIMIAFHDKLIRWGLRYFRWFYKNAEKVEPRKGMIILYKAGGYLLYLLAIAMVIVTRYLVCANAL